MRFAVVATSVHLLAAGSHTDFATTPILTQKRTTLFLYRPTKKFPQCTGISADFLNLGECAVSD
jgi:hypothetical protein